MVPCKLCGKTSSTGVLVKNPAGSGSGYGNIVADLCGFCAAQNDREAKLQKKMFPNAEINEQKQLVASDYAAKRATYLKGREEWIKNNPGKELPINADSYYNIK